MKADPRLTFVSDSAGRPCFWAAEAPPFAAVAVARPSQAAIAHPSSPSPPPSCAPLGAVAADSCSAAYAEAVDMLADAACARGASAVASAPPVVPSPCAEPCAGRYERAISPTVATLSFSDGDAAGSGGSSFLDEAPAADDEISAGAEKNTAADNGGGSRSSARTFPALDDAFTASAAAAERGREGGGGDAERGDADADPDLLDFFSRACGPEPEGGGALERGTVLADRDGAARMPEAALLGHLSAGDAPAGRGGPAVYLNTHEPFCLAAVGVQGGGKSHTLACVLEGCLVPVPRAGVVRLRAPMAALVLHYDFNPASVCEATGLAAPNPALLRWLAAAGARPGPAPCLPRERLVVLVSPAYYRQRRAFYGGHCTVRPLLFRWNTLSADHLKRIMRVKAGDGQLYVAAMLDLLRRYQRDGVAPSFAGFLADVKRACRVQGQAGPLEQRLALLESLVAESAGNRALAAEGGDLRSACAPGTLVVADLTDPLLASDEANAVFQVLTEQFRALPVAGGGGKVLALDEAHRYMDGAAGDGLSQAVVNVARLMRHDGVRLVVSTQSPRALAPELLELVSAAVLHRFHSRDWCAVRGPPPLSLSLSLSTKR